MATPLRIGNKILINALTNSARQEPGMTALADGRHVVCWTNPSGTSNTSATGIRAQVCNADGSVAGPSLAVNTITTLAGNQLDPAVAGLADGRFVVAWVDFSLSGADAVGAAIRAQVFLPDGSTSGDAFLVNAITHGNQFAPSITTLADGRFMAGGNFIGGAGFANVAGQVRYDQTTGLLSADVNGDGSADFAIELTSKPVLTSADVIF